MHSRVASESMRVTTVPIRDERLVAMHPKPATIIQVLVWYSRTVLTVIDPFRSRSTGAPAICAAADTLAQNAHVGSLRDKPVQSQWQTIKMPTVPRIQLQSDVMKWPGDDIPPDILLFHI